MLDFRQLKQKAVEAGYHVQDEKRDDDRVVFTFSHDDDLKSCDFPNEAAAWLAAGQHAFKQHPQR